MLRPSVIEAIGRHQRIALQLSGGRDSIATLYLLRAYLDRITVYWVDTGAAFPETLNIIGMLRTMCPRFVKIKGDQPGVIAAHGIPSDIVPAANTPIGLAGSASGGQLIQDRYSCCARTIMFPLHERMVKDGITLIIRGQKNADALKAPIKSGAVLEGIEYLFPVEDWDGKNVLDYLREVGAPVARFYQTLSGTPDCMTCSAYWEEGVASYLKQHHPEAHTEVQRRLDIIKEAVAGPIAAFNNEVQA